MRKATVFTLLFLLTTTLTFGQRHISSRSTVNDSLRLKVYADFINKIIPWADSLLQKQSKTVFVGKIDSIPDFLDLKYLKDFLNGNIKNNEHYKRYYSPGDGSAYFNLPGGIKLGSTLTTDKEIGELLVKILEQKVTTTINLKELSTNYNIRALKHSKRYFKMGWEKFHRKYPVTSGIILLSDMYFNSAKDRVIFYAEDYRGNLLAAGFFIVLRKVKGVWIIDIRIDTWMS